MTTLHILVTGGAGYIGSILTRLLLSQGHHVTVLDRLFFGRQTLPPDSESLRVIEGDIRTVEPSFFEGIEGVIDLAAISNDPAGDLDPALTWSINHAGRVRVAKLAKQAGVKRYVLPSSCSLYGFQDGLLDENAPVKPLTTYAQANLRAEQDILPMADTHFCVVAARQATVYGASPRMRFDLAVNGMVRGFLQKGKIPILRDGTQWRPMIHVKDTSRALRQLLIAPTETVSGKIFNVGSDAQNYQILPLAQMVAEGLGLPFAHEWYGDPDHRSYRVDFRRIREAIAFSPQFDATSGASEVAHEIRAGKLDGDDPRTITVNWYKRLFEQRTGGDA